MKSQLFTKEHNGVYITHIIYGTIVVAALLLTLQGHETKPLKIILSIVGTMIVLQVASVYSEIVGARFEKKRRLLKEEFKDLLFEGLITISASLIPIIIFVMSALGFIQTSFAFTLAKSFAVLLLFAYGIAFGRITGRSWISCILIGIEGSVVGGVLILLNSI
ncbi:MAG TPA: hypothetical protein VLG67_02600, partial [Candidatus Saccharimonadales bacterium]|nr:hypothetical protein [Candidatus Saccharimonadales bacterium]